MKPEIANILERRAHLLGHGAQLFYDDPVHIVRGEGVWLTDADGRRYVDAYNNVAHVGHCHPRVVEALCRQAGLLNTHTRYLHTAILDYVERLTATFAPELTSALLTCTGSEANDVALRIAQVATGSTGLIATDATYHGNTSAVSQLGTLIPPVGGRAPHIRLVRTPDTFRTPADKARADFADDVAQAIRSLQAAGFGVSALVLCPLLANEGLPELPAGFFDPAIDAVRQAGGLVIADEVQAGFGRSGTHFWGHQRLGLQPDIVTLGKPMGNGHPIGGVVTSEQRLSAFRAAFRYFNTFAGNPVSCAVANAVLDVLEDERLVANALSVGNAALELLGALRHDCIGDVRGSGLFIAVEIVKDRNKPAPEHAARIINAMRENGVLIGRAGIHGNVLKIRPPMPFAVEHARLLAATLASVLDDIGAGS